jgi:colicin import membrane protein
MATARSLARANGLLRDIIRDELDGDVRARTSDDESDSDAIAWKGFDFGDDDAVPRSPIGAAIDAASDALTRRRAEATSRAAKAERDAAREMREAKEALDRVVLDAKSTDARVEAYERAIAARDLELFKMEALVASLKKSSEANASRAVDVEGGAARDEDTGATRSMRAELERAQARASAAEDGARAMRDALKTFETTSAREKVALRDELREARAAVQRYADELDRARARERAQSHGSSSTAADLMAARRELATMTKKLDVSAAVNAKLESLATERAEEIFNITQERDALKKKLRTTSETIDALERDWIEFSQRGEDAQSALRTENEELHALVDALKESEKSGFAQSENEILALREELDALRESAPVAVASAQANRSVDRRLARESIASLRATIRDLRAELDTRDVMIENLKRTSAQHATLEAVHAEKDSIIRALQEQINAASSSSAVARAFDGAPTTAAPSPTHDAIAIHNTCDVNALDELQSVASTLRRENAKLRRELDAVDPELFEESITLKRRVTAQDMLLASYEERLVRYTAALGIPFDPEPRP